MNIELEKAIKEILDYLKRSDKNKFGFEQDKLIDYEETQLLLDYITNLQQEKEDYKSRCEKAVEIIKKEKEIMGYAKYDSCLLLIENILQNGGDKFENI